MKIIIIGGGASGLMAGGILSQSGHDVTIIEKNEKVGKKIYITGKGRCNLTNNTNEDGYLKNVVHGEKFMFSAINAFSPQNTIDFFENLGLKTKVERGGRIFPLSDKASDVTKALLLNAKRCKIILNENVLKIEKTEDNFCVKTNKNSYFCDKVVVATGGKSYQATGSTGDGVVFASNFGIKTNQFTSALVPIKLKDKFVSSLQGVSLKNVSLCAKIDGKDKSFFGEMLFTKDALSGPIALSMSSFIGQSKNVNLSIDFKPALTEEQLLKRLQRDFSDNLNKNISYIIKGLLPNALCEIFLQKAGIRSDKKVNSITTQERTAIICLLKSFPLEFDKLYPVEAGIVSAGGVDLKEINPKTMESKKVKGLYFIGETLDIDCLTGGYNLQTAFSTAYQMAKNIL